MLTMVHAITTEAVRVFQAADNPIDAELLADLERVGERTRVEIETLTGTFANPS